jgi:outer membrane immunogenic protein
MMSLAAGLMVGATCSASAADLGGYTMKDEMAAPALWQGRYFGVVVGATGTGVDVVGVGQHDEFDIDGTTVSGGILLGYNFRKGNWVGGFEADINGTAFDDSKNVTGLGNLSAESSGYATLRVRGGYAWDNFMLYATGGLALTHYSVKSSLGGDEDVIMGTPVLGIGAELALDANWTGRIEALAIGMGEADIQLAGANRDVDFAQSTIRIGFTRRF